MTYRPSTFGLIFDTKKVKRTGRKIFVEDYLDYIDRLVSLGLMKKVTAIPLKIKIQTTSDMAKEHQKVHSFYLKDFSGRIIGAIRCFPNGEIDIGKLERSELK